MIIHPIRFSKLGMSDVVLWATIILLSLAAVLHVTWLLTGHWGWMVFFFHYPSPIFFVTLNVIEFAACIIAWTEFSRGQSLKLAWALIACSSGLRLVGGILAHVLSTGSYINPLYDLTRHTLKSLGVWGLMIGGAPQMLVFACGLFVVMRVYKRLGLLARPSVLDWTLLALVTLYTLHVAYVVTTLQWESHHPVSLTNVLDWAGDPMICVLLFEAIFIRRAVVDMGWGFVGRCWGAFAAAIFLTSLGSMGQWAINFSYIPWPENAFTWYIWYPVSAAFALAPIYQVEAARTARARLIAALAEPAKLREHPAVEA